MRLQVNSTFITKILSCHKLWHYILQNKENKRQIPSSLSIHLRLRGGTGSNVSLANETFKGTVGGGGVSLLGMVPGDHSVKNYRSTELMKVKLFPLDKPHVQRVVTAKIPIPRDTRNALKAVECHRG